MNEPCNIGRSYYALPAKNRTLHLVRPVPQDADEIDYRVTLAQPVGNVKHQNVTNGGCVITL